jgi:hypothetical protein
MAKANFTTPVGRLVQGSLYVPQTTDSDGKPLLIKNGPNAGQPTSKFFFAVAIPKNPGETHWAQTAWGALIWQTGHAAFPQQAQSPAFAWKITDGDSTIANTKGKRPCDREGYPGNWIISFSSSFAPKIYNRDGSAAILEPEAVKPGYYVQVNGDVDGNGSTLRPGVYLNHSMVALAGFGPEIHFGPDVAAAGFGAAPLPVGATTAPVAAFVPPAAPLAPAAPAFVPPYGAATPPVPGGGVPPASPSSVMAPPNPAFNMVPPPPAAPVAPPARVMTAAAQGATYQQLIAAGWTDQLLIQHGMMVSS